MKETNINQLYNSSNGGNMDDIITSTSKNTDLWTIIISFILFFIGLDLFLYFYGKLNPLDVLLNQIGITILAIGLFSLIWQLSLQKIFLKEILTIVGIKKSLNSAGIVEINENFNDINNWDFLFDSAKNIDILFLWGRSWRRNNKQHLERISEKIVNIRLILPDPREDETMNSLSYRLNEEDSTIRKNIIDTREFFEKIFQNKAHLEIWVYKKPILFSMYRFDQKVILALFSHRSDKEVPAFKFKEGKLCEFLKKDINYLTTEDEYSEIVFDNKNHINKKFEKIKSSNRLSAD